MPTVQITMNQRIASPAVELRNVFYIEGTDVGTAEVAEAATGLYDAWNVHLKAPMVEEWSLYSYTWRNVSVAGSQGVEVFFATPLVGLSTANDPIPFTVAGLVSFRTGTPPPNQGRKYIAGMSETSSQGGTWVTTFISSLQAWGNAVVALNGGPFLWEMGIARIDPVTGLATAFNAYATALARSVPATMRSRRPGVGI